MVSNRIFLIPIAIGLGMIVFGFLGNPLDPFDDPVIDLNTYVGVLLGGDITGLTLIDVPIDPTTNQILGTIKFGAPIIVPFERSGTILSADGACVTPIDINNPRGKKEVKFGRVGSGDPNSEVYFHGWNGRNCAYGYAEWDLTEIPNSFKATGFTFQLNLKQKTTNQQACYIGFVDDTFDSIGAQNLPNRMIYGSNTGGFDRVSTTTIPEDSTKSDFLAVGRFVTNNPKFDTDWCESTGVKRWTFSAIEATGFRVLADGTVTKQPTDVRLNAQRGVDAFNQQLQFDPIAQLGNDKFMIVFYGNGAGGSPNVIDQQWWETNGSLLVTGTSQPLDCNNGFTQEGFKCVPKVCPIEQFLNLITNECVTILCEPDEVLTTFEDNLSCPAVCIDDPFTLDIIECGSLCSGTTIQRSVCVPEKLPTDGQCPLGEVLIGETCVSVQIECTVELNCQEGTQPDSMNCSCDLITCPTGKELVGSTCQNIVCPINTRLMGSDCLPLNCPIGQVAIDNLCQKPIDPITNQTGFCITLFDPVCGVNGQTFSNSCFAEAQGTEILHAGQCFVGENVPKDCPIGTVAKQNTCVNVLPDLLSIAPQLPNDALIIAGAMIAGLSTVGFVLKGRR